MPWSEPGAALVLITGSGLLSALATAWARRHALRRGLLDAPGERRSHEIPTPRGGGIGIALVGLGVCAWLGWIGDGWWWIGGGLLLVAAAGWWDDHRPLPAWPRLSAHILAAACLALGMAAQGASPLVVVAAFVLVPILVNVWNFMDGIDGLIGSQSLLAAAALACVLAGPGQVLAIALAAACIGFLPFNLPRSRIFLGDVGSGASGYLLAVLLAAGAANEVPARWPLLLLPAVACMTDSALTLAGRMQRREAWWQPHVQHLYQQLARRHGHLRITLSYALWTAASCGSMLVLMRMGIAPASGGAALVIGVTMLVWRHLHGRVVH